MLTAGTWLFIGEEADSDSTRHIAMLLKPLRGCQSRCGAAKAVARLPKPLRDSSLAWVSVLVPSSRHDNASTHLLASFGLASYHPTAPHSTNAHDSLFSA
ncbi:hypothetical protein M3J09_011445 [Ascochyta lentis]